MSDIITRAQWGARRAKARQKVAAADRSAVMVHYSTGQELGVTDTAAWVRNIQAFHQDDRGWADIGYNFLVDRDGRIYEGRGWDYQGAHCPGWNDDAWGVCFLGNDDPGVTDAPAAALESIRWLYDQAVDRAGRSLRKMGHRDGKSTACPGDELYAWVRAGMPAASADRPPAVQVADAPTLTPPPYPLPSGYYYGPKSGPRESVSGFYQRAGHPWRLGLQRWQRRMIARGWSLPSGADGLYGDETAHVADAFQAEKGLTRDALIGPQTWAAAWTAPVTR